MQSRNLATNRTTSKGTRIRVLRTSRNKSNIIGHSIRIRARSRRQPGSWQLSRALPLTDRRRAQFRLRSCTTCTSMQITSCDRTIRVGSKYLFNRLAINSSHALYRQLRYEEAWKIRSSLKVPASRTIMSNSPLTEQAKTRRHSEILKQINNNSVTHDPMLQLTTPEMLSH